MPQQPEDNPSFLKPIDVLAWGGYAACAVGVMYGLSQVGTVDAAQHTAASVGKIFEGHGIEKNPQAALMGIGFLVGCAENVVAMGATLAQLNGKIRMQGTGIATTAEDGILEYDQTCVDARTPLDEQDIVEPGSGLMQGLQLRNMLIATWLHNIGEGAGVDVLVGYMMGRALPAAAVSTAAHAWRSLTAWLRPAERVIERDHGEMCGWSATGDWLSFWLKFTHQPSQILDTLNLPSRVLQVPVNALEQAILVPLSGFKSIKYPGSSSSIVSHENEHAHDFPEQTIPVYDQNFSTVSGFSELSQQYRSDSHDQFEL